MFRPTADQLKIIDTDLLCQRIVACAGSGKTATAVRRLLEIRRRLGSSRAHVALLSYSQVAVETFRREYTALRAATPGLSARVLISTVDSFITSHILLPHSSRTMGCNSRPFLVLGKEPFLKSFKVYNGARNVDIEHLRVSMTSSAELLFREESGNSKQPVAKAEALRGISRLGKVGAYTHDIGRYWALETLQKQKRLLTILACRYPYILVDEAQDVGTMHGAILNMLQAAGCVFSLIGDPNQAIYEFADADGSFLRNFNPGCGVQPHELSQNRRSVAPIVALANAVAKISSESVREAPVRKHGAYVLEYSTDDVNALLPQFETLLQQEGYEKAESAVVCRGKALVQLLSGREGKSGSGATEKFALAAIHRDLNGSIADAYESLVDGILKILSDQPATLRRDLLTVSGEQQRMARPLRQILWSFLKDRSSGLPCASLPALTVWLPLLKTRLPGLFVALEALGLKKSATWTHNVTTKDLPKESLREKLPHTNPQGLLVKSIHKVKGESIGAVLYIAKPKDLKNLLRGPVDEEGRVAYVAITRARDLLIVAIPSNTSTSVRKELQAKGLLEWQTHVGD